MDSDSSLLLLRCCHGEPWWGELIARCLRCYFIAPERHRVLPLSQIFMTLNEMCLRSLAAGVASVRTLFVSLFGLLEELLKPLDHDQDQDDTTSSGVEVSSLEWLLLFIARLISFVDNRSGAPTHRWQFLDSMYSLSSKQHATSSAAAAAAAAAAQAAAAASSAPPRFGGAGPNGTSSGGFSAASRCKNKLKKKIFQSSKYYTWSKLKESRKSFVDKHRQQHRHLWRDSGFSSGAASGGQCGQAPMGSAAASGAANMLAGRVYLPRDAALRLGRLVAKLLTSANSYCSSDLFVLACRLLAAICVCSRPAIGLAQLMGVEQLAELIKLGVGAEYNHASVSWGSPWSQHALVSLLIDVIENEKAAVAAAAATAEAAAEHNSNLHASSNSSSSNEHSTGQSDVAKIIANSMNPNTSVSSFNVVV